MEKKVKAISYFSNSWAFDYDDYKNSKLTSYIRVSMIESITDIIEKKVYAEKYSFETKKIKYRAVIMSSGVTYFCKIKDVEGLFKLFKGGTEITEKSFIKALMCFIKGHGYTFFGCHKEENKDIIVIEKCAHCGKYIAKRFKYRGEM